MEVKSVVLKRISQLIFFKEEAQSTTFKWEQKKTTSRQPVHDSELNRTRSCTFNPHKSSVWRKDLSGSRDALWGTWGVYSQRPFRIQLFGSSEWIWRWWIPVEGQKEPHLFCWQREGWSQLQKVELDTLRFHRRQRRQLDWQGRLFQGRGVLSNARFPERSRAFSTGPCLSAIE